MASNYYHVTLKQGRADTLLLEADSKIKVLSFFSTVSTATVRNIKEIVVSKDLNLNFVSTVYVPQPHFSKVNIHAKSATKSKIFTFRHMKKNISDEFIFKNLKKMCIADEPIEDIYSIQRFE